MAQVALGFGTIYRSLFCFAVCLHRLGIDNRRNICYSGVSGSHPQGLRANSRDYISAGGGCLFHFTYVVDSSHAVSEAYRQSDAVVFTVEILALPTLASTHLFATFYF